MAFEVSRQFPQMISTKLGGDTMDSVLQDLAVPSVQKAAQLQCACVLVTAHWRPPKTNQTKEGNVQVARAALVVIGCTLELPPLLKALSEGPPRPASSVTPSSAPNAARSSVPGGASSSGDAAGPVPIAYVKRELV